jgi:hypothetical protein
MAAGARTMPPRPGQAPPGPNGLSGANGHKNAPGAPVGLGGPAAPGKVAPPRPAQAPPPGAARPRPVTSPSHPRWQEKVHINPHLSKRWRALLGVVGVLLVLAICGAGSYLMVLEEKEGSVAQANNGTPKPSVIPVDITSREVDPKPLTTAEVFPHDSIVIDPARPDEVYKIVAKQELNDCRPATKGEVTTLLTGFGCNQVVRATMRSPSDYLVTGGIFNLDTQASAEKAWESIRSMVETQKGGFIGYAPPSDKNTKPLVLAATVVGWNMKGHYLAFCVIARADGQAIPDGDPFAKQVMYDIVEIYLKGTILEARATDPAPGASASP